MLRRTLIAVALLVAPAGSVRAAESPTGRLDALLVARAAQPQGVSRVIVQPTSTSADAILAEFVTACGGRVVRRFTSLPGLLADVPDGCLAPLSGRREVRAVSLDRPVRGALRAVTRSSVGAAWVADRLGYDGTGVGVAIVDSGVAAWHEDLTGRVLHFADFVNRQREAYDDYGHGTHVAGIIAGTGGASNASRRGIAPGAHLVVLKALDGAGDGNVSHVVSAIDYAVRHRTSFNIRVLNLSVAAGVYESYHTDPLTQAARRAVDAGIVVVTAAGNLGRDASGAPQAEGISAPGNAPWVVTVGAANDRGTASRRDDIVAAFSSRGPSAIDSVAKPDLVAPGVGIESAADPSSFLFATRPVARRWGGTKAPTQPYLSLSGTSMAAPIVAGAVALMLQANPSLSPDLVKTILQRTAEASSKYDALTQGAGFLDVREAVDLARAVAAAAEADEPLDQQGGSGR